MPHAKKLHALVFSRKNIGEADRLVTFFTKEHGLIRAIAKGVRKIPSSRGGHLEPLTSVHVLLNEHRAGNYVSAIETDQYFRDLHEDSDALFRMRRVIYAFMKLFDEGQDLPDMFDAMHASWANVAKLPLAKRMLIEASLYIKSMQYAGVLPDFDACAHCGIAKTIDAVVLDAREGLWRCISCYPTLHGARESLSPRQFSVLRYIAAYPDNARRIAISQEDAVCIEHAVHGLIAHAIEEQNMPAR